jgi:hypothetical protein
MSFTQRADVAANLLELGVLVWWSVAVVARWIRRGRIEDFSQANLTPKWLRQLLARISRPGILANERTVAGITVWGWLVLGVLAVWIVVRR